MSARTILTEKHDEMVQLCRTHGVERLELFGSAVSESFEPGSSDLDFLVTFLPCSPSEHYDHYFGLLESLEALYGRPVDLVDARAIRNPYFAQQVNATKQLCYAA